MGEAELNLAIIGSRDSQAPTVGHARALLARDWVAKGQSVTVYCRKREDGRRKWTTEGVRCIWTPACDTKGAQGSAECSSTEPKPYLPHTESKTTMAQARGWPNLQGIGF